MRDGRPRPPLWWLFADLYRRDDIDISSDQPPEVVAGRLGDPSVRVAGINVRWDDTSLFVECTRTWWSMLIRRDLAPIRFSGILWRHPSGSRIHGTVSPTRFERTIYSVVTALGAVAILISMLFFASELALVERLVRVVGLVPLPFAWNHMRAAFRRQEWGRIHDVLDWAATAGPPSTGTGPGGTTT